MGDVKLNFTSSDEQTQKAFDKLNAKIQKTAESAKKAGDAAAKSGKQGESAFAGMTSQIGGMVTGFVSVGTALAAIRTGTSSWQKQLDELEGTATRVRDAILKAANASGDLRHAKDDEAFIRKTGVPGTAEQRADILTTIKSTEAQLSRERMYAIGDKFAELSGTGANIPEFVSVGTSLADMLPGKSADDVADITAAAKAKMGGRFNMLAADSAQRAIGTMTRVGGMGTEDALGLIAAAGEGDVDPRLLEKMTSFATKEFTTKPKSKAEAEFRKMGVLDRLKTLASDEETARAVMGEGTGLRAGQINFDRARELGNEFRTAQREDFFDAQKAALAETQAGREALSIQANRDKVDEQNKGRQDREARYKEYTQRLYDEAGDSILSHTDMWINRAGARIVQGFTGRDPTETLMRMNNRVVTNTPRTPEAGAAQNDFRRDFGMQIVDELKKQTGTLKEIQGNQRAGNPNTHVEGR